MVEAEWGCREILRVLARTPIAIAYNVLPLAATVAASSRLFSINLIAQHMRQRIENVDNL